MKRTFKVEDIESVVEDFLNSLGEAHVIGFSGNLGAGKTTFTKSLLKKRGSGVNVVSPTFVLRRDYDLGDKEVTHKVIHIDAYRLEKPEQIYQVISKEELANKNNLIIIEWPEKVNQNIFDRIYKFDHVSDTERSLELM